MAPAQVNSSRRDRPDSAPTPEQAPEASSGWLEIGKIVAPQGLKGEVKVYLDSDFPERLEQPGKRWILRPGDLEPQAIKLLRGRYLGRKRLYVVQFAEVVSRDQAEALRGCLLLVPEGDRPPLAEGEFHIVDLIGLEVFNQDTQKIIGCVISVVPAGNDLLEVKSNQPDQATFLIPLVREVVPVVDLQNRRVEITPPKGLLPELL